MLKPKRVVAIHDPSLGVSLTRKIHSTVIRSTAEANELFNGVFSSQAKLVWDESRESVTEIGGIDFD